MPVHICAATFRDARHGPMIPALAIVEASGMSDVQAFIIFPNGQPCIYQGEVWGYQLNTFGSVSVQSGAASFDI